MNKSLPDPESEVPCLTYRQSFLAIFVVSLVNAGLPIWDSDAATGPGVELQLCPLNPLAPFKADCGNNDRLPFNHARTLEKALRRADSASVSVRPATRQDADYLNSVRLVIVAQPHPPFTYSESVGVCGHFQLGEVTMSGFGMALDGPNHAVGDLTLKTP
ncbi:MAG TPA: hypothetical protein VFH48_27095 [Chloroflexota bacterium]|nr:hypothetical protein [Chloroflexota bacterium]